MEQPKYGKRGAYHELCFLPSMRMFTITVIQGLSTASNRNTNLPGLSPLKRSVETNLSCKVEAKTV